MSAAEKLSGLKLNGGWTVANKLSSQSSTGAIFSVPYLVHDATGICIRISFVDVSAAIFIF
jgi:hypothetical protein